MTVEDPVEYKMEGINQIQVNDKLGLTFDVGLRSILRQDPDVIMVGEIRDIETANIAIRAAITGHLVISTMHTKDAISSIERLKEMGIPSYLISSSLIGIISQKLIKKQKYYWNDDLLDANLDEEISIKIYDEYEIVNQTNTLGRTAIYEILEVDDEIKNCIVNNRPSEEIKRIAIRNGMITFSDSLNNYIMNNIYEIEESCLAENI